MNLNKILAVALLVTSTNAAAFIVPDDRKRSFCVNLGKAAAELMTDRQNNVPIEKYLNQDYGDKQVEDLFVGMVIDAYRFPKFDTPTHQNDMIQDFKNKYVVRCFQDRL